MAFAAGTIWDVRASGDDATTGFGGGFDTGNANFATDLTTDTNTGNTSSPVVSSASYNFVAGDVGHWLYVKSGTNWTPGLYQIASVASNKATLTAGIGTAYLVNSGVPYAVTTAAGCATVGTPTSGTWGIDYSQSTAAGITYTDMVIDGATNTIFTSAANPVGKNIIGNVIAVSSGTGFTVQRVQVVSTSGTQATVDKSLGTLASTGGNGKLGGSFATPGMAGSVKIASNSIFIKSGTYTCSSSANVSGGKVSDTTGGTASAPSYIVGWGSVRTVNNSDSTLPLLQATANSMTILNATSNYHIWRSIKTGRSAAETSVTGFSTGNATHYVERCTATSLATGFSAQASNSLFLLCFADTCTTGFTTAANDIHFMGCVCKACTGTGFSIVSGTSVCVDCISYAGTGGSTVGFVSPATGATFVNCTAYGNGSHGFSLVSGNGHRVINCVSTGNAGNQFNMGLTTDTTHRMVNCAAKADGTGTDNSPAVQKLGFITLTADPFTNAAGGDFSLNATAGGGAACKAAGILGAFNGGSTTGYADIGAVQSAAGSSGGVTAIISSTGGAILRA